MSARPALGARGERPVFFPIRLPWERVKELTRVPGIARAPGGLACTWDVAPLLAQWIDRPCPDLPLEGHIAPAALEAEILALPGLARYRALGLSAKLREYQKEGALFLARRAWALNSDPMRSGKSVQALAASVLIGARRTLVVCPALAKYVWADEAAKWLEEEALILEGRGGVEARRYCRVCAARGRIETPTGFVRCEACKMRNGQSRGYHLYQVTHAEDPALIGTNLSTCRRHGGEFTFIEDLCPKCLEDLDAQISCSRYVIVNYDLLVAQKTSDAAGVIHAQAHLQGWAPVLAKHHFDLAVADEAHLLRGFSTDQSKKGQTRRERFAEVTENIDRVWALTGTPIFGYVRDLWGILDAVSKGACTSNNNDRLPFAFHARYCDGAKDDYGWKADGRSLYADTELPERLNFIKIQRPRSLILSQMPPKTRQVLRIDADSAQLHRRPRASNAESKITALMKHTLDLKIDQVVENVINELSEGNKVVVFALLRASAEKLGKAIDAATQKNDVKTRMREVQAKVWTVHGDTTPQGRFEQARSFREHPGAGAFVATIDAVQVAVSLKGASSVHFAELHWQPAALLQAEDRPYEVGVLGLSIVYYVVRGSIDEHLEAVVLPKVQTLADVLHDKEAVGLKGVFKDLDGELTLKQVIDRLTKDVNLDMGALEEGD